MSRTSRLLRLTRLGFLAAVVLLSTAAGFGSAVSRAGASPLSVAGTVEHVWAEYQRHWAAVDSFEAAFTQRIEVSGIGGEVKSAGSLYFQKPDKLRWNYEEGPPQSVVGDGHWLWIYQPDLDQVYKVEYSTAFGQGGLVGLLAGREGLSNRYTFSLLDPEPGTVHLKLEPSSGAGEILDLILSVETFELRRVIVRDPAGSVTYLDFEHVVTNVALEPSLFHFTAPEGVDIITGSGR